MNIFQRISLYFALRRADRYLEKHRKAPIREVSRKCEETEKLDQVQRDISQRIGLYCIWLLIGASPFSFMIHLTLDAVRFNKILAGSYGTPWYSPNWLAEPYTNIRLYGKPKNEYWTKNVVGDDWYVREVDYSGKQFWTVLKVIDMKIDDKGVQ